MSDPAVDVVADSKDTGSNGHGTVSAPIYSPRIIAEFDRERLVTLDDALSIVQRESLDPSQLQGAISSSQLHVYGFRDSQYVDRLDLGRVYHEPPQATEGLTIRRYFTDGKTSPYDSVGSWERKHLKLTNKEGDTVFEMADAEFPRGWDDNQAQVVARIYFLKPNKPEWQDKLRAKIGNDHESSLRHLVGRVTNFYADEGWKLGYFRTEEDREAFRDELAWLQMNRMFAFNTPVQINAGIHNEYGIAGSPKKSYWRDPKTGEVHLTANGEFVHPQTHACFIKGPRDNLDSILEHFQHEGEIFASGSGIGQNIGALRGQGEPLSGGGVSSGAVTFLRVIDRAAGVVKSGGKSRRAARMTEMRVYHTDATEFVRRKVMEDHKALDLMKAGWSSGFEGEAYTTVDLQNTNLSVQCDDDFFAKVVNGGDIEFKRVVDGKVVGKMPAKRMLQEIAFGSWRIGDPAIQYESEIQRMHTCSNSGRINSTNPCSEYVFLDDTSCNLASLNLVAFCDDKGNFNVEKFKRAARIVAIAQDISNSAASYPVEDIAVVSPEFRTIGLGYANLGTMLMRRGVAYDSDEGRALAGAITALMTGVAYETSAEMASGLGTFVHYELNKRHMQRVVETHRKNLDDVVWDSVPTDLKDAARKSWDNVVRQGQRTGFRNAQATVLAPTGTISYLMGCDTTGVEPGISLRVTKNLSGGGQMTLCNSEVGNALKNLGYAPDDIRTIEDYIKEHNTAVGAPALRPAHVPVFATAFGNKDGIGSISLGGHLGMLGATQPFISGAISKTNNVPEWATVKDIYDGYLLGHKLRLKAVSVFRNNSKPAAALDFGGRGFMELKRGEKEALPDSGPAWRHKFEIGGIGVHLIVGEYPDGRPGQLFIESLGTSELGGLFKSMGVGATKALQRGVDLEEAVGYWVGWEMPNFKGIVKGDKDISLAASPQDYIAKLLLLHYKGRVDLANDADTVDVNRLQGAQNGAIQTYHRMTVDDWDVDAVLKDADLGGFEPARGILAKIAKGNRGQSKISGKICAVCHNPMEQYKAGCHRCNTPGCGNHEGGCGI